MCDKSDKRVTIRYDVYAELHRIAKLNKESVPQAMSRLIKEGYLKTLKK